LNQHLQFKYPCNGIWIGGITAFRSIEIQRIVALDTSINPDSTDYIYGDEIQVPGISMLMLVEDYFSPSMQFEEG